MIKSEPADPRRKTAAVIGGSLGGLFIANLLYRAGWDVKVYEKASGKLEARGAGIVRFWADGIPPPLIRPELLTETRSAARRILAPQFSEVVEKTEGLFFQPINDLESPQLAFGRVALLGDAAFVARPHCGMGVAKAADDAVALADALSSGGDVPFCLTMYSHLRSPVGGQVVKRGRELGAYMQAKLRTRTERRMADQFRRPESIMKETAVYVRPSDYGLPEDLTRKRQ